MADIFLIQPPIRDFYLTKKRTIPYGLSCIAASLIERGFSVEIFDGLATSKSHIIDLPVEMNYLKEYYNKTDLSPFCLFHHFRHFGYNLNHIGEKAKSSQAFLIGISSLFTAYSREALETAETVKRYHPDCKIVLGGHHPTALPEKVMENGAVDFVIRGEGERSLPMLAEMIINDSIKQTQLLKSIPGIVFRNDDGTLQINEPAMVENLNENPLPAIHLVKNRFYRRKKRGSQVVVTSRGCPMKCSYCCVGSSSLSFRRRSVESVLDEINQGISAYDTAFIDFEDENLSLDKKWFMALLREIISRFGRCRLELRAMNGLFPPSLDEELILNMKKAGFKTLNLSVGSTSKEQLMAFKRPDVISSLEDVLDLSKKYDLETICYLIAGAPGQTAESSVEDLLYLAQKRTLAGVSIFYPAPGSSDYKLCSDLHILPNDFLTMRSSAFPISHTTTRLESVTILRLGRLLNFMKALIDLEEPLPKPDLFEKTTFLDPQDSIENGKQLLRWFLCDGVIRGINESGEVFEHITATHITRSFIGKLTGIKLQGNRDLQKNEVELIPHRERSQW